MIESPQNAQIKHLVTLREKSRTRRAQGVFLLEGLRELGLALQAGWRLRQFYYCPAIVAPEAFASLLPAGIRPIDLSEAAYRKAAVREGTEGVLAVMEARELRLDQIPLSPKPFVIILEAVEKPGNLGAVLRTADAARADAVLICDPLTDLYNPNVIRSSVGCLFTVPTAVAPAEEIYAWLQARGIAAYAATLQAAQWYHQTDLSGPSAIVMGTEATGLGTFWREHATANIKIPMRGAIDSLNVSVSTAILSFEAMRQRNFQ